MTLTAPTIAGHADDTGFTPLRTGRYPNSLLGVFSSLRQMLLDAQHYRDEQAAYAKSPRGMHRPEYDASLEALVPVIDKLTVSGAVGRLDYKNSAYLDVTDYNVGATYAWTGGPGTVHSACAKAGVVSMTRTLAVEWARYKIRVNAIAPGPVETEGAGSKLWATPEVRTAMLKTVPRGRLGTPEEIAQASAYLVSDFADFITGEVLVMDGGQWLGKGMFGEGHR